MSDGTVTAVGADLEVPAGATVLDAGGCLVAPGLVDLHTHLRQPGGEEAETVETAARARGPRRLHGRGGHAQHRPAHRQRRRGPRGARPRGDGALCRVAVAGAITVGRAGRAAWPPWGSWPRSG